MDVTALAEGAYWKHLGMTVEPSGDGDVAAVRLTVAPHHFQVMGRVHGGVLMSLIDSAVALAVHAAMPEGSTAATVDLHTLFLRPVDRPQTLMAVGRVLAAGRTVATAEASVVDEDGREVARGSATYRLYPAPAASRAAGGRRP